MTSVSKPSTNSGYSSEFGAYPDYYGYTKNKRNQLETEKAKGDVAVVPLKSPNQQREYDQEYEVGNPCGLQAARNYFFSFDDGDRIISNDDEFMKLNGFYDYCRNKFINCEVTQKATDWIQSMLNAYKNLDNNKRNELNTVKDFSTNSEKMAAKDAGQEKIQKYLESVSSGKYIKLPNGRLMEKVAGKNNDSPGWKYVGQNPSLTYDSWDVANWITGQPIHKPIPA